MQQTLPMSSRAEAQRSLEALRRKGWTEEELAEKIMPYIRPEHRSPAPEAGDAQAAAPESISIPPGVSRLWLDQHLPPMDRRQIRLVVEELERRGWVSSELARAVVPHLLPKLSRDDASAILSGLEQLGLTDDEIALVVRGR